MWGGGEGGREGERARSLCVEGGGGVCGGVCGGGGVREEGREREPGLCV